LEDFGAEVDINNTWEVIREDINTSAKENELKNHKPWFDEGCSKLLAQEEQDKLQWLQDPSELNGDNLNKVKHESRTQFRNEKEGISERQNQ
jgi:hypothetical protein